MTPNTKNNIAPKLAAACLAGISSFNTMHALPAPELNFGVAVEEVQANMCGGPSKIGTLPLTKISAKNTIIQTSVMKVSDEDMAKGTLGVTKFTGLKKDLTLMHLKVGDSFISLTGTQNAPEFWVVKNKKVNVYKRTVQDQLAFQNLAIRVIDKMSKVAVSEHANLTKEKIPISKVESSTQGVVFKHGELSFAVLKEIKSTAPLPAQTPVEEEASQEPSQEESQEQSESQGNEEAELEVTFQPEDAKVAQPAIISNTESPVFSTGPDVQLEKTSSDDNKEDNPEGEKVDNFDYYLAGAAAMSLTVIASVFASQYFFQNQKQSVVEPKKHRRRRSSSSSSISKTK